MLIWIKAPFVAVGILASFAVMLNTVVSDPVVVTEIAPELTTTSLLESTTVSDSSLLMNLPFAQTLKNPCSWDSDSQKPSSESLESVRVRFVTAFYKFVSHYASLYKENVNAMLQNHTLTNCAQLEVKNLPHTPTLVELQALSAETAMNKIYLSLLVHSAYSYFVHHEFVTKSIPCSANIALERLLSNQTLNMALKQKALACYVRLGMAILEYKEGDILPLLSARITDLSMCSRRSLRDCQVMKSMYNFLDVLSKYFATDPSVTTSASTLVTSDYETTTMGDQG